MNKFPNTQTVLFQSSKQKVQVHAKNIDNHFIDLCYNELFDLRLKQNQENMWFVEHDPLETDLVYTRPEFDFIRREAFKAGVFFGGIGVLVLNLLLILLF